MLERTLDLDSRWTEFNFQLCHLPVVWQWASCQPLHVISSWKDNLTLPGHFKNPMKWVLKDTRSFCNATFLLSSAWSPPAHIQIHRVYKNSVHIQRDLFISAFAWLWFLLDWIHDKPGPWCSDKAFFLRRSLVCTTSKLQHNLCHSSSWLHLLSPDLIGREAIWRRL